MQFNIAPHKVLSIVLWLTAIHSAAVGIGLVVLPDAALPFFGFDGGGDRFFRTQGGVFHLVMAVAYLLATRNVSGREMIIGFAVFAKFAATLFLIGYSLVDRPVWSVIVSAAGDFLLGMAILTAYRNWHRDVLKADDLQVPPMRRSHV